MPIDKSNQQQVVEVRVVEAQYRNRIEYEDGPGSLQNVVSDSSKRFTKLGRMTLAIASTLSKSDLEDGFNYYFEEDSYDGFEEYSYTLEFFDPTQEKWRYINTLH